MTVMIKPFQDKNKEKIWKVIRALREFTIEEVSTLTEIAYQNVALYVNRLFHAGYIRQGGMRKNASGKKVRLWQLAKNTGPKAPIPCRCIYDPNIDDATVSEPAEVKDVA